MENGMLTVGFCVVSGRQECNSSLLCLGEQAVSLCPWIVKDEIEPLGILMDSKKFFITCLGCRDNLHHGEGS